MLFPERILLRNAGSGFFYQAVHLVSNIHEPESHVKRSPERSGILGSYLQDQGRSPIQPASGDGTGIDLILEFRRKGVMDMLRMISGKPEHCFVRRQDATQPLVSLKKMINYGIRGYAGLSVNGLSAL